MNFFNISGHDSRKDVRVDKTSSVNTDSNNETCDHIENHQPSEHTNLDEIYEKLHHEIENIVREQQRVIATQHEAIIRFQNDQLLRNQRPLINELIGLADQIHFILSEQESNQDYETLLNSVKELKDFVRFSLEIASVRPFQTTELMDKINPKRQEVIENTETDDQTKMGLYESYLPGYVWTMPWLIINSEEHFKNFLNNTEMPSKFEYIVRPEQIIKYQYSGKANDAEIFNTESESLFTSNSNDNLF